MRVLDILAVSDFMIFDEKDNLKQLFPVLYPK